MKKIIVNFITAGNFVRNPFHTELLQHQPECANFYTDKAERVRNASFCKRAAFTLAEVLITLGIIGVVAAMTMPSLINKYQEKVTVTKLKKMYNILSNAYLSARIDNGDVADWGLKGADDQSEVFVSKILPYLKVSKNCGYSTGCFPDVSYRYLTLVSWYSIEKSKRPYKLILADGSLLAVEEWGTFATIFYDVNGFSGPNVLGQDLFDFFVIENKVVPGGDRNTTICKNQKLSDGAAATAWVIYNENMDYLRCLDKLDWNTKTTCD